MNEPERSHPEAHGANIASSEPVDEPGNEERDSGRTEANLKVVDMESEQRGVSRDGRGFDKLDLLSEVSLQITVELGSKEMAFGEVLQLGKGSVIELNKLAEEPVEVFVNHRKIAEGEVVVVDEHFGVRITRLYGDQNSQDS